MIRRGFWLTVGAVGGIMGYRRAVSAGRAVSGALSSRGDGPRTRAVKRGAIRGTVRFARGARGFTREAGDFTRDVREGMELYTARHPGRRSPTLPAGTPTDAARMDAKEDR